jgi:hypothetical protein
MFCNVRPAVARTDEAICAIAVDAEEDFDWHTPVHGVDYSTRCMDRTRTLQDILKAYGAVPTYLLSYPILENPDALRVVRRQFDRGECAVGAHLHPWVNPPFDGAAPPSAFYSYSGNLDPQVEERKLVALTRRITECFGERPQIYRAGRYGLGRHSAGLLERLGFTIDTSVAPHTRLAADGGPDYTGHDHQLFWSASARGGSASRCAAASSAGPARSRPGSTRPSPPRRWPGCALRPCSPARAAPSGSPSRPRATTSARCDASCAGSTKAGSGCSC